MLGGLGERTQWWCHSYSVQGLVGRQCDGALPLGHTSFVAALQKDRLL
jgi:hypothetical protein